MPGQSLTSKTNWSKFQQDIFDDVKNGEGNIIVLARSGSGKTSTLLEALRYIPSRQSILLVAFNKRIALELQERAPQYNNLDISTLHSFGYKICKAAIGKKLKFDPEKDFKIACKLLEPDKKSSKDKPNYEAIFELRRCVSLCKSLLVDTPSKIDLLMDEFNIQMAGYDRDNFISKVIQTLGECKKQINTISFDDMVWFPFIFGMDIPKYDWVVADEFQDVSKAQFHLIYNARRDSGRILTAGDDRQLLYRFRGIELNSLDLLEKKLNAKILPLPISYRCAKQIIYEAQKIVPDITYRPNAPEGEVIKIAEDQVIDLIKAGDFVISRTNAELIRLCFECWRNKIPANLKGKELGIGLTAIIKQSKKKTVPSFLEWLDAWEKEEKARLKAKNRSSNLLSDKIDCLRVLCDGQSNLEGVKETIKSLFDDKDKYSIVHLHTAHSSKGLQANRVFVLMKSFRFGTGQEEMNCIYVAKTRAQNSLYLVQ